MLAFCKAARRVFFAMKKVRRVWGATQPEQNAYRIWLDYNSEGKPAGQRECVAADESARAHRLCKAMGGVQIGNSNSYILQ